MSPKIVLLVLVSRFLWKAFWGSRDLKYVKSQYKQLMQEPVYSVSQALAVLKEMPVGSKLRCIIKGFVDSNKPLRGHLDPQKRLVHHTLFRTFIYSNKPEEIINQLKVRNKSILKPETVCRSFLLNDIFDASIQAEVTNPTRIAYSGAVSEISRQTKSLLPLSWPKRAIQWIQKMLHYIILLGRAFKGVAIKQVDLELGVQQGQFVQLLGNCFLDPNESGRNRTVKIEGSFMVKQKEILLRRIEKTISNLKLKIKFYLLLALVGCFFFKDQIKELLRVLWHRGKQLFTQDRAQENRDDEEVDSQNGQFVCCICYDKPADTILRPCKHYALCKECVSELRTNNCPICKRKIQSTIPVIKIKNRLSS